MRHDKIISSTQIHVLLFPSYRESRAWAVLSREWKKGARERPKKEGGIEKVEEKRKGEREHGKKRATARFARRIMTFLRERPCICISSCNRRGTSLGKRKVNGSLHIYLLNSPFRRAEEAKRVRLDEAERAHTVVSFHHWPGTIDEDFLNDGRAIMLRTSLLVLYPRHSFAQNAVTRL